ncbi:MAG: pentapeptide repeat-containing protein [Turicibacter sp.]|nr:pentapeptide repeat-containing protein [Turicibacter sp.]
MNNITVAKTFKDTGVYQREKENLTYHIFNNLDFSDNKRHISFFRSDFRGSNFTNVKFYRNNFDRADFISCTFRNCHFTKVNFGSCEIKNCYFENVTFEDNIYKVISAQQNSFFNCRFVRENLLVSMYDCKFEESSFVDCNFERSSTERLEFLRCEVKNTNLATMHAEHHRFISCKMEDVCIDPSYVFGYLFYGTSLEKIDYLHRGESVSLEETAASYGKFLEEARYFEYLNAGIIFQNAGVILQYKESKAEIVKNSLEQLSLYDIVQLRKTGILDILNAICFYVKYSMLSLQELVEIEDLLQNFDWSQFSFEETLEYQGKVGMISSIISSGKYPLTPELLGDIPLESTSLVEFYCDTNDFDLAFENAKALLDKVTDKCGVLGLYSLIDKRQGSWELVFAIPTLCAVVLPFFVQNIIQTYGMFLEVSNKKHRFSFDKCLIDMAKKSLQAINLSKNPSKASDILALVNSLQSGETNNISKKPSKDIVEEIAGIIKLIKIGIS